MSGAGPAEIEFRGARLGYPGRTVLEEVRFTLARRERVGLLGPNGSGKTTLLRTMLGILAPLSGEVSVRPGLRFGFVPQRERFDPVWPLSAVEVVLQGLLGDRSGWVRFSAGDRASAREKLAATGVAEQAEASFRELSGGQQQRVLLARALVRDPDWLVLDEPTAGLDFAGTEALLALVDRLHRETGTGILLVSHQLTDLLNHMDSLVLVNGGGVEHRPVAEAFDAEVLSRFYGARVECRVLDGYRIVVPATDSREMGGPA